MFDNYGYFVRNLRYVINITLRNLRYGAMTFYNSPYSSSLWQKKSPKLLARRPLCNLVISSFGAEKKEEILL